MIEFIDVPDDLLERDPARLPPKLRHLYEAAKRYKWGSCYKAPTGDDIKKAVCSVFERKNIICKTSARNACYSERRAAV